MNREMLQKLFSEDKEIFQGGMLFPAWICKGKKEIENRNSPQRAAVYLDIPIPCAGLLYYEKEKSLHYCEQQTYHVVTLLEGVGCGNSIEKENWQRLAVLAGKGMIDVIVVSGLSRLGHSLSSVDMDYFVEIRKRVLHSCKWYISYFSESDLDNMEYFAKRLDIKNFQPVMLSNL